MLQPTHYPLGWNSDQPVNGNVPAAAGSGAVDPVAVDGIAAELVAVAGTAADPAFAATAAEPATADGSCLEVQHPKPIGAWRFPLLACLRRLLHLASHGRGVRWCLEKRLWWQLAHLGCRPVMVPPLEHCGQLSLVKTKMNSLAFQALSFLKKFTLSDGEKCVFRVDALLNFGELFVTLLDRSCI